jgi:hypothetical protein
MLDLNKATYEMKKGLRRDLTAREVLQLDVLEYRDMTSNKGTLNYISLTFAKTRADHIEAALSPRLVRAAFWLTEKLF